MAKRGRKRSSFVPELVFGTLCATTVIPACSSSGSTSPNVSSDSGIGGKGGKGGTGGIQGVAAGGFGGFAVAAGGFGGLTVAAGGFGGVAAGGFGGFSVAAGGFGGLTVAAGGFGGVAGAAGQNAGDAAVDGDAQASLGTWAVTDAFGELALAPGPSRRAAARGRRVRRRR